MLAMRTVACSDEAGRCSQPERVLRYPDGNVRTIRYPLERADDVAAPDTATDDDFADEAWFGVCRDSDPFCQIEYGLLPDEGLPGAAPHGLQWVDEIRAALDGFGSAAHVAPGQSALRHTHAFELPASPSELLAYLRSPEYLAQQQAMAERIAASYTVLPGCPWPQRRPVHVIAFSHSPDDPPVAYTLPTRIAQPAETAELSRVLGIGIELAVDHMRDGVVCFTNEAEADCFRSMLEADGHFDVLVTEVDSHALFRMTHDVSAVVVLMGQGDMLPRPRQLATSLRGSVSMDEFL